MENSFVPFMAQFSPFPSKIRGLFAQSSIEFDPYAIDPPSLSAFDQSPLTFP